MSSIFDRRWTKQPLCARAALAKAIHIETLESRRLLSTAIAAAGVNDLVFDDSRDILYITTTGNGILRYDVANKASLPALNVPGTLLAGDITPDGASLYLTANDAGVIRKVNLATGTYSSLSYSGYKPIDIGIAANGKALFTTTYPGSGWVPVWQIDTATDAISTRSDYPGGSASQDGHIGRSADGATLFLAEGNNSSGPLEVYRSDTDSFPFSGTEGTYTIGVRPAVSRDGTLGSYRSPRNLGHLSVRDLTTAALPQVAQIRYGDGAIFSPTDDIVYVSMTPQTGVTAQYIAAYDTNTWQLLSVIPVGATLKTPSGASAISDDGRYLFFQTTSGVQMYDTLTESLPSPIQLAADGMLTVSGFDGDDVIDVTFSSAGPAYLVTINNVTMDVPASDVSRVVVSGGAGDDKLTLSGTADLPVEWDGGAGTNTLVFGGTSGSDTLTLDPAGLTGTLPPTTAGGAARSVSVAIANSQNVTINGGDGADHLSAYGAPAGATWSIRGGLWGGDTFTRGPAAGRIDMHGSSSGNTFIANGTDAADEVFIYSFSSFDGGRGYRFNGVDSDVYSMSSIRFNLLGGDDRGIVGVDYTYPPTTIDGGAGNDTLGQRNTSSGGTAVSRPITYLGGDGDDRFLVADRKIYTIDGGDGIDGMVADAEDIVTNVEHVGSASISGTAFNDTNRNGVLDSGEAVLNGAIVYIDENNDGARQGGEYRVTTGTSGTYTFAPLMASTYVIRAVRPDNQVHLALTGSAVDGHTVTIGWSGSFAGGNFGFAPRLYPATEGMPDAGFGQWGNVVADYSNTSDYPMGFGQQSSGKIIVAGYNAPLTSSGGIHAVRRFHADGSVDTSFAGGANGGWARWNLPGFTSSWPTSMLVLPDDRILLAGGTGSMPGLSRLTAGGMLDTTFNGTGTAMASTVNGGFGHLALLPDGRFYVTGWAWNINSSSIHAPFVARYNADGTPDNSFGPNGIRVLPIPSNRMIDTTLAWEDVRVEVDVEGRPIIVLPTRQTPGGATTAQQVTMLRLRASDGAVDMTFGAGGEISFVAAGQSSATPQDFKMLSDGRMVISGYTANATGLFVARLLPDGSPDPSFATGGFHTQPGNGAGAYGHFAAPTADGKLVLSTRASSGGIRVMRLSPDGHPDLTFAADSETPGTIDVWIPPRTSGGIGGGFPRGLLVQSDGKPLAMAMVNDRGWDFALVRLLGADPNAGKPTATFTTTRSTPDEGAAVSVSFSGARAGGGSGSFRYSFDFDNDGTYEIVDSTNASATIPAALLDDGPASLAIRGRIREVGGTTNDYFAHVVVTNVAPTALVRNWTSSISEGSSGARIELGGLTEPSQADVAAGLRFSYDFDGDGTWDVTDSADNEAIIPASYYADGPRTLNMRARVADKDDAYTDYTMEMTVNNAAPTAFGGSDRSAVAGTVTTLLGAATDPSPTDTVTAAWIVRDAEGQIIAQRSGLSLQFLPPSPGTYTAELIATDDDGAEARNTVQITATAPAFLTAAADASYRFSQGSSGLTLTLAAGSLTLVADAGAEHPGLDIRVEGGLLTLNTSQHLGSVQLTTADARVALAGGGNVLLRLSGLTLAPGAVLDMADNDLLVDYTGASPYAQIRQYVMDGRSSGVGIVSSIGDSKRVVAPVDNAQFGRTSWNGQEIDPSTVIATYTYYGDSNLDGKVTGDDYVAVDSNLGRNPGTSQWFHGDFNFDGYVTGDDYVSIDSNLGAGTAVPPVPADTAEEPIVREKDRRPSLRKSPPRRAEPAVAKKSEVLLTKRGLANAKKAAVADLFSDLLIA